MSVDDLQLTRNKRLLEEIRKKGINDDARDSRRGYAENREGSDLESEGRDRGDVGHAERIREGLGETDTTVGGSDTGSGSPLGANVNTTESVSRDDPEVQRSTLNETPEERRERELELQRQRNKRYRDKKKAQLEPETVPSRPPDNVLEKTKENGPTFQLKNPFKGKKTEEKVKLFTQKEVEEELDRMTAIYQRGSDLLDDVLEIIVKDHEPVQIWHLSDDEAQTFAELHLQRATKNIEAARSARKLLDIYDRLYTYMIVLPRVQATGRHILAHKGLSFK